MTFWIDPTGDDGTGDGSFGNPWKTLAHAGSQVFGVGDIIRPKVGLYPETVQTVLAVGVSIEGFGDGSWIQSALGGAPLISLNSGAEGTDGNQSISYLKLDGDSLTGKSAIEVRARKNVSVHHCTIFDFFTLGVEFAGKVGGGDGEPAVYATGNKFYDNTITNCADYEGVGHGGNGRGMLEIGGQEEILVYNNPMVQTDRGIDATGYVIKFTGDGYYKGLKIYNNTITKPPYDGSTWDFAIELWNCRGGIEIYDNDIQGSIDIGGNSSITNDVAGYGFAMRIHDNTIGQPVLRNDEEVGIHVERGQTGGFYVYNNKFNNLYNALLMYQGDGDTFEDFYVYYNIINIIGLLGGGSDGNGIDWGTIDFDTITYDNINFLNNVLYAHGADKGLSGLRFTFKGDVTNLTIRNNIIEGFDAFPIYCENCTIDIMSVENNIFFDNNDDTPTYVGCVITNKTEQNNIVADPDFVIPGSDFRLQGISPGINSGIDVGLDTDYAGNSVSDPPEIGAYEFIIIVIPVTTAPPRKTTPTYTHTFDDVAVDPHGDWSIVVKKASEDFPYCRDYRLKLEGELTFVGDDYDLINSYDCCDQIEHKIYCDNVLYFVCYWGYPLQFEFNEDLCQTSGTPTTLDKYYWFDRKASESNQLNRHTINTDVAWEIPDICDDDWIVAVRDRCTLLFWIIDWYAGQISAMSAVSAFFNDTDDNFPDGSYPEAAGINYVTGFPNKLKYIVFAMARHIFDVTENPDYPTMSWNDFMTVIHDVWNTWWYIDENGDVRIEHVSFWDIYFPVSYDLIAIDGGRWIENSSKYDYLVDELPRTELWDWNEHLNGTDFLEQQIVYDCSLGGTNFFNKEHLIQNLTTDLEYISQNWGPSPADVSDSVYMFLRCIPIADVAPKTGFPGGTDYAVWYSEGARTGNDHLNAHLSASNLHVNYWIYDRSFWEGLMIGNPTVFESTEKIKKQTEIFFPVCCDNETEFMGTYNGIDLYKFGIVMNEFITTQYGNGEIYTGTIDFGNFTIELIFENDCKPDPYVPTFWPDKEYY